MRYLSLSDTDRKKMLKSIGVSFIDDLYKDVASNIPYNPEFNLPDYKSELEVEEYISKLSQKNLSTNDYSLFLGGGCYYHHIPSVVDHIIQRSEYLTSYTPYQPEVSQGTLISIFEFQSYITEITGMDISNASMYDGATSLTEAVLMAKRVNKKRHKVLCLNKLDPNYSDVLNTYSKLVDIDVSYQSDLLNKLSEDTICVVVQVPDYYGNINQLSSLSAKCKELDIIFIVVTSEILAYGLLPAPIEVDVVVGEAGSLGIPMSFGGPKLGFFSAKQKFLRQLPGRICGKTKDLDNNDAYVLTLCAREQHIKREKATSNICSNQGLCALAFTIHISLLGEIGFKKLAKLNHLRAVSLYNSLCEISSITPETQNFFNEFVIKFSDNHNLEEIYNKMLSHKIIPGLILDNNRLLVAVTEMNSQEQINSYITTLKMCLS